MGAVFVSANGQPKSVQQLKLALLTIRICEVKVLLFFNNILEGGGGLPHFPLLAPMALLLQQSQSEEQSLIHDTQTHCTDLRKYRGFRYLSFVMSEIRRVPGNVDYIQIAERSKVPND